MLGLCALRLRAVGPRSSFRALSRAAAHYNEQTVPSTPNWEPLSAVEAFESIPYDSANANYASVMGVLGHQPELKAIDSTRRTTRLSVAINKKDKPAEWMDVDAWNELADSCCQFLTKGARICAQGSLKVSTWRDRDTDVLRKKVTLVAKYIFLVEESAESVEDQMRYGAPGPADFGDGNAALQPESSAEAHFADEYAQFAPRQYAAALPAADGSAAQTLQVGWEELRQRPEDWWDNRESKWESNPKRPDFVHKQTKTALWLNRAPAFILEDDRFQPVLRPRG